MVEFNAYAAMEQSAPLAPFAYEPAELDAFGAEIEISHCGICHSDVHLIDNDWGSSKYPLVPGHEIVGKVVALGEQANPDLLNKRVGVGWQRSSCQNCDYCIRGENNLCAQQETTTVNHYGGFAERIRVDSRFCFPIPDALEDQNAAPLLCAGVTVYGPMHDHNVRSSQHVGVVGIGGLGHLAVQFAAKMGCEVTAFSGSPSKADEAKALGASNVVNSRDVQALKSVRNSLDFIISTVSVNLEWNEYLKLLRPHGTLCFVGALTEPFTVKPWLLSDSQRRLTGSSIGGRTVMQEMLNFAARHQVQAWTEVLPFDAVNTAVDRLKKNDVRYRFVLEH